MLVSASVRPIKAKCHFFQPQRESSDDTWSMLLLWPTSSPPPPKEKVPWSSTVTAAVCFHSPLPNTLFVISPMESVSINA